MKVWIYLDGRQQGPFEMEDLAAKPGFDANTRVWYEGLPKWYPAGTLEPLAHLFAESCASDASDASAASDASSPAPSPAPQQRFAPGRMYRPAAQPAEPCPPTYLGWSIFLLICCCSPLSLGALVASIFVSSLYAQGNLDGAKRASEWAAWLIMLSFALGMIPMMIMSAWLS